MSRFWSFLAAKVTATKTSDEPVPLAQYRELIAIFKGKLPSKKVVFYYMCLVYLRHGHTDAENALGFLSGCAEPNRLIYFKSLYFDYAQAAIKGKKKAIASKSAKIKKIVQQMEHILSIGDSVDPEKIMTELCRDWSLREKRFTQAIACVLSRTPRELFGK
jgi:hypothetical protein